MSHKINISSNNCEFYGVEQNTINNCEFYGVEQNTISENCEVNVYCENTTGITIKRCHFECNGTITITLNNSRSVYLFGNLIEQDLNIDDSVDISIVYYNITAPMSFRKKVHYVLEGD
jgi:hypothetical protein